MKIIGYQSSCYLRIYLFIYVFFFIHHLFIFIGEDQENVPEETECSAYPFMTISVLEKNLEQASNFIGKISHSNFANFSSENKNEISDKTENDNGNENENEGPKKKSKKLVKDFVPSSSSTEGNKGSKYAYGYEEEMSRKEREMSLCVLHLSRSLSAVSLVIDSAKNNYGLLYSTSTNMNINSSTHENVSSNLQSNLQTAIKRKESASTLTVFTALKALGKQKSK